MPEPSTPGLNVFAALSDPTRRTIVDWLAVEESGTATAFADRLPMSRQAVARHLLELEKAGIVVPRRSGRETRFSLRVEPLSDAADWLVSRASLWDRSLGRLKQQLES